MELFLGEDLKERRIKSTLEYLIECREENIVPIFKQPEYFEDFLKHNILVPYMSYVRVRVGGALDHSFMVVEDGMLEGLDLQQHGGPEGKHKASEILDPSNAKYGWEIESYVVSHLED